MVRLMNRLVWACALAFVLWVGRGHAQVIEFETNGLKYQTLTKSGVTIMFATLPQRLTQRGDLFAPVLTHKQNLRVAIEKLEDLFRRSHSRSHSTTASKEQSHRSQMPKKKRLAGPVVEKVTQSTTRSTRVKAARGRSRARH